MANIIVTDLGDISIASSSSVSALEERVTVTETKIDELAESIQGIDTSADSNVIEKLQLASGVKFGQFVSGYYRLNATDGSILSIYESTEAVCCVVSCKEGDTIHINANGYAANGLLIFLDESMQPRISAPIYGEMNGGVIIAPSGASMLLVNSSANFNNPYVALGTYTDDDIVDLNDRIDDLILIQSNQPTSTENVLWFDPDEDEEVEVPTVADLNTAIEGVENKITNLTTRIDELEPGTGITVESITEADIDTLFAE